MTAVFDTSAEAIINDIKAIPELDIIPGAERASCSYYNKRSVVHEPFRHYSFAFKLEALKKRVVICMDCRASHLNAASSSMADGV